MRYCYALTQQQIHLMDTLQSQDAVGFEIRLDTFDAEPDWAGLRAATTRPLLATWRSEPHLGKADPNTRDGQGWTWRCAALAAGFEFVDVELDEHNLKEKIATIQQGGGQVVLSHHELGDNAGIDSAFEKALATHADILKIIGSGRQTQDLAKQRDFYNRAAGRPLVHFYMGSDYAASRVLCLLYGGSFTFLTPDAAHAVAPGQLTYGAVDQIFRPLDVDGNAMRLFAVIGLPIGHSKSPEYHNQPLKQLDPNAVFLSLPAANEEDYENLRRTFPELTGMAVTKPMKEIAFHKANAWADPHAPNLGAVNTLLFNGDTVRAANTDLLATIEILKQAGASPVVRILGYGGLGKAVVRACVAGGISCQICNRTPGRVPAEPGPGVTELPWEQRHDPGADVLVQCTSAGMAPKDDVSPLDHIPAGLKLMVETIYNPMETRLMTMARDAGVTVLDGMALFQGQARIQNNFFREMLATNA